MAILSSVKDGMAVNLAASIILTAKLCAVSLWVHRRMTLEELLEQSLWYFTNISEE